MTISQIRHNRKIKSKIMSEAWLSGYNVKSIACYFKIDTSRVYTYLPIRDLKVKKMRKEFEQNRINS